jgi:hypothetical protein
MLSAATGRIRILVIPFGITIPAATSIKVLTIPTPARGPIGMNMGVSASLRAVFRNTVAALIQEPFTTFKARDLTTQIAGLLNRRAGTELCPTPAATTEGLNPCK